MHKVDRILNAAQKLFAQKGFETTPISEIASLAEVSPGTIIYYFKSKDNLLFIVTWRVMHALYKKTVAEISREKNPLECIYKCAHIFFSFIQNNTEGQTFLLKNTAFDTLNLNVFPEADLRILHGRYIRLIEYWIRIGIEKKNFTEALNAKSTSYGIYALMIGAGKLHFYHHLSMDELEDEVRAFIRARLLPQAPFEETTPD